MSRKRLLNDRSGIILVISLLMLAMLTIMAVFSATRAAMDQKIASNAKWKTVAFFASEAGLNHATELLTQLFADNNANSGPATPASWNFLIANATHFHCQDCDQKNVASLLKGAWLTGGVTILTNQVQAGSVTFDYTVYAWDNAETVPVPDSANPSALPNDFFCQPVLPVATGATPPDTIVSKDETFKPAAYSYLDLNPDKDCDSTIVIRSVGQALKGGGIVATSIQELTVSSTTEGEAILSGLGQEFEGSGDIDLTAPTI